MKFNTLQDFSDISGVGIHVIDGDGVEQFHTSLYRDALPCLDLVAALLGVREKCQGAMAYSGKLSMRFGGRYVFLCPRNFVFFASPILLRGEHHLTAIGGPVLMRSYAEYIDMEIESRVPGFDRTRLFDRIGFIPVFPARRVNALSEQLFVNTAHLSDNAQPGAEDVDVKRLQEYLDACQFSDTSRTFFEERKLINTLAVLENAPAKSLLNEILGHVLFHSGKNIDMVKIRVVELIAILSNAALRDGGDIKKISDLTYSYSKKVYDIDSIEGLISWLNGILEEFSVFSLKSPLGKHANALRDTIHYINQNYNLPLRLEDLARRIYISPAHFSTLFKAETGYTFKAYLNKVRIEQSKMLMQNKAVNLAEISDMVGFTDQSYFTRVFKKQEGKSPNRYRSRMVASQ
ncbi:MAG: AraC family transcriptional regulator [Clostridiales Family XIII bacterium]|jgi:AraC-like DNA-binding protein/ligand-binding sensor protein|nr:AraC family transcriptional regulator [Clostridiales Family XIII bacterium]